MAALVAGFANMHIAAPVIPNSTSIDYWPVPANPPANPTFIRCEMGLLMMVSVHERGKDIITPAAHAYQQHRDWFNNPWRQMCQFEMCVGAPHVPCKYGAQCRKYHPPGYVGNVCRVWFRNQMDPIINPNQCLGCGAQHPTVNGYVVVPIAPVVPAPAPAPARGRGRGRGGRGRGRGGRGRGRGGSRGGHGVGGGIVGHGGGGGVVPIPTLTIIQTEHELNCWYLLKFLRNFASHFTHTPLLFGVAHTNAAKCRTLYPLYRELISAMVHILWFTAPIANRNLGYLEECLHATTIGQMLLNPLGVELQYDIRTQFITPNTDFTVNNWYPGVGPVPVTAMDFTNLPLAPGRLSSIIHALIAQYVAMRRI